MLLHTPTLLLAIAVVQTALSVVLLFFLLTRKTYPGIRHLVACQVLWCVGYILLMMRGVLPSWLGITVGNGLFMLGSGLVYTGLAAFVGAPVARPMRRMLRLGGLVCLAMLAWHTHVEPNVYARVVEINAWCLAMSVLCLALVLRHRASPRFCAALPLMLVLFGASIALTATRSGIALSAAPSGGMHEGLLFRLHILVDLFVFVLLAFITLLLSTVRNEQELEEARRQADHIARADPLTGLWNRLHFESAGQIEEARAQRYGLPLSVMMFDIDHFKAVNDRCGHLMGDRVIRTVANVVTRALRTSDLVFRWGGEEFVVLLPVEAQAAADAAEKLRQAVEETEIPGWGRVTISIGVAQMEAGKGLAECLQRADKLLYRAKAAGRNCVMAQVETLPA